MEDTRQDLINDEEPFIPRLEMLRLAFEIEDSASQRVVHYVDVGSMPRVKAEEHLKSVRENATDANGDLWIGCSENDRRSEVVVMPGRVTLEKVMKTAEALRAFVEG